MVLIRALHWEKYHAESQRFPSDSFNQYKGGISVFDEECAKAVSNNSICEHIQQYYQTVVGTPIIFCRIPLEVLKTYKGFEKFQLENTESESHDFCHYDIVNTPKNASQKVAKGHIKAPNVFMCCDGQEFQLTQPQYEDLLNNLC